MTTKKTTTGWMVIMINRTGGCMLCSSREKSQKHDGIVACHFSWLEYTLVVNALLKPVV